MTPEVTPVTPEVAPVTPEVAPVAPVIPVTPEVTPVPKKKLYTIKNTKYLFLEIIYWLCDLPPSALISCCNTQST